MTTIQQALQKAASLLFQSLPGQFSSPGSARREAQLLLEAVLQRNRSYLYTYPEQELSQAQEEQWQHFLDRRAQHEPVAYIIGHQAFFGLDFLVDRRVLIPRPETELLVERALLACQQRLQQRQQPVVADIGTGSGAIAISLAVQEPRLHALYACDISEDALTVARLNCIHNHVEQRIKLLQGYLLNPLPEPVDILLANLPYVGTDEQSTLQADVLSYEPHLALFSGPEGLNLLNELLQQASQQNRLKPGALILLEIGYQQADILLQQTQQLWPHAKATSLQDYAGWQRFVQIELPERI